MECMCSVDSLGDRHCSLNRVVSDLVSDSHAITMVTIIIITIAITIATIILITTATITIIIATIF